MNQEKPFDLSDVTMRPIGEGESDLEAEVTTQHGVARLTIDLSRENCVPLTAVLPSGESYTSSIESWANDTPDHETDEGRASILRLAAAFVVQCFEKERLGRN